MRAVGMALPANPPLDQAYLRLLTRLGLQPGPTVVRVRGGARFRVFAQPAQRLANNPDYYLYYFGTWEPRLARAVQRLVLPGDTCLDVGANIGWYTLLLARVAGPAGRVYALEPDPRAHARLLENVGLNLWARNVAAHQLAVADAPGTSTLFVTPEALYSSLYHQAHGGAAGEEVRVTTLDAFAEEQGIGPVHFVKCDVEGAEMAVLRGAERLLTREAPPVVQLEVNPQTSTGAGTSTAGMLGWLGERGYRFYRVAVTGRLLECSGEEAAGLLTDIFCLNPRTHADRLQRGLRWP
jgi:FkbM family methyltransferase